MRLHTTSHMYSHTILSIYFHVIVLLSGTEAKASSMKLLFGREVKHHRSGI